MTTSEKAKAYDEAIEKLRDFYRDYDTVSCLIDVKEELANLFPALKESEGERIRKELITHCRNTRCVTEEGAEKIAKWIAWLEKQGRQKLLYIRFGDIPSNEKSKIYHGEEEIGDENGVSVYPAFELNGNIVLGLTLPITKTTLYTQQHLLEYDNRPCYLVSGDYVGKGTDGEPLIKNISIIKKLDNYRIKECEKKPVIEMITPEESLGIDSETYNEIVNACIFDENKPKFKVGDYITNGSCSFKISSIDDKYYWSYEDTVGGDIESINNQYHLWTIEDARGGDVLATKWGAFIVKQCLNISNGFTAYCGINSMGRFDNCDGIYQWTYEEITPAAKEQRDLLFSKMKEADYEWDSEKKELKKVDVELTDFEKSLKHIMIETIECGDTHNLKADAEMLLRFAQKPAEWSEEDEKNRDLVNKILWESVGKHLDVPEYGSVITQGDAVSLTQWLKSLKERIRG